MNTQPDKISKYWPKHYHGRVPVKVRMKCHLGPDFHGIMHAGTPRIWLDHGEEYPVKCNQHGALSVETPHGELGIKLGEHEIIEWREPNLPTPKCPKCGSEGLHQVHHAPTFALPECDTTACAECDWVSEPS